MKKITRAMEMASAAKMRKAIEAVLRTRTYANLSWETVLHLSQTSNGSNGSEGLHPLLTAKKNAKRIGIILVTSNRGLCGGFNMNVIKKVHESIKKHQYIGSQIEIEPEIILIGKKGQAVARYYGYKLGAEFPKEDFVTEVNEVIPIAKFAIDEYLAGNYDKVMVGYTDFVNAARQVPRVKQLLPVEVEYEEDHLGIVGEDTRVGIDKKLMDEKKEKHLAKAENVYDYTFEPSPREVLDEMVPRLIEVQLFQALLESNASEHSARMAAMHQATEAAGDMIDELTLFYNKARQAGITREIAEISAGANALVE
jgi:F-type H+-transporting ATPase subunit gamma